jgi:hypothetical protein
MGDWQETDREVRRKMKFKSSELTIELFDVVAYKAYSKDISMLKHKDGVFAFSNDDVSWISSIFMDEGGDWLC